VPADDQFPFNSAASRDVDGVGGADPWPLFVFNDRPLMSPMELMLVPGVSPQHLTTAMVYPIPTATPLNPYTPDQVGQVNTTPLATGTACPTADLARPFREFGNDEFLFGYLLNFFRQVGDPSVPPYSLLPNPGYFRLFEYVEVPSRMNGARSGSMAFGNTSGRALNDREPGKLNINTIYEQPVFQAALNNHPFAMDKTDGAWISPLTQIPTYNPPGTTPVQWATSKTAGAPYADLNSELFRRVLLSISNPDANGGGVEPGGPRLFTANDRPFRGFDAGQSGTLSTIPSQTMPAPFTIQSTFLRGLSDPFLATAAVPVFEDNRTISPPGLTAPPNNQTDYPNYRWQLYQKMSNIFTTRSNVFAVWMTVGYFEVFNENPARLGPGIIAPPQLGGEFNADIGKNIRHRAFFVVDRSRARGYTGPPRNAAEIQDVLGEVVILSRILE
jgi:hypothetical protein